MKFAIIAAGEGSRLQEEGIATAKPLVEINGERLIDRLIRIFKDNEAEEIIIICNEKHQEVATHLAGREGIRTIYKSTASSMHSFHEMAPWLKGGKFILTTVDTVFSETAFKNYVKAFRDSKADAMMAVTDFIDDEKPLYINVSSNDQRTNDGTEKVYDITGFLDSDGQYECRFISAGIYGLSTKAIDTLERCIAAGQSRMRNFQRALLTDDLTVKAYPIGKVFDIDHKTDIDKARRFLPSCGTGATESSRTSKDRQRIVAIYRGKRFSPNRQTDDKSIMDATLQHLKKMGMSTLTISEEELAETTALLPADCYLSMARSTVALKKLKGKPCLNSPEGIAACNRREYIKQTVPPPTPPLWVKRADCCAENCHDVVYCKKEKDVAETVKALHGKGVEEYIMQPHYEGDIIKFYGVRDSGFFYTCYPQETGLSKFGTELQHTPIQHYPFSMQKLKEAAHSIATQYDVAIYGGDAIIGKNGDIHIIDFNDWPSFAPCREEAAKTIAESVIWGRGVGCFPKQPNNQTTKQPNNQTAKRPNDQK